nr:hypothetical protein [Caldicellulosiruptor naganoensis]
MTGFQPYPGIGQKVTGEDGKKVGTADLVRGIGKKMFW